MFREELTPILRSLLQKKEKEGTLSNSFYAANNTAIPNQTKYEEKNIDQLSLMNIETKVLNKMVANKSQ